MYTLSRKQLPSLFKLMKNMDKIHHDWDESDKELADMNGFGWL
jgi:hypothetical protein